MLNENFYYMIFTRHSARKIWSSICIQNITISNTINLISFLYEICLTSKSDENCYLYVQNTEANKEHD